MENYIIPFIIGIVVIIVIAKLMRSSGIIVHDDPNALPEAQDSTDEEGSPPPAHDPARVHTQVKLGALTVSLSSKTLAQTGKHILPQEIVEQAGQLARSGNMIGAIKLIREHAQIGLTEAKMLVDGLANSPAVNEFASDQLTLWDEVRSLKASGKSIEAIKLIRERLGTGLADAREMLDKVE